MEGRIRRKRRKEGLVGFSTCGTFLNVDQLVAVESAQHIGKGLIDIPEDSWEGHSMLRCATGDGRKELRVGLDTAAGYRHLCGSRSWRGSFSNQQQSNLGILSPPRLLTCSIPHKRPLRAFTYVLFASCFEVLTRLELQSLHLPLPTTHTGPPQQSRCQASPLSNLPSQSASSLMRLCQSAGKQALSLSSSPWCPAP